MRKTGPRHAAAAASGGGALFVSRPVIYTDQVSSQRPAAEQVCEDDH